MKKLMKLAKNEDGAVLVLTALLMIVLIGFAALVVDVGNLYFTKAKLQNAADAAALAGAEDLTNIGTAVNTVVDNTGKNGLNVLTKNIVTVSENVFKVSGDTGTDLVTVTTPYESDLNKIEVVCKKTVPAIFAIFLNSTGTDVSASGVAEKSSVVVGGDAFGYAVFAGGGAVTFTGGKHTIGGSVYGKDGIYFNGNSNEIDGDAVRYNGDTNVNGIIKGSDIIVNNPIPMPDFSAQIKAKGIVCNSQAEFDAAVTGKLVNGLIYVNGNVTIKNRIQGNGIICATGNINADSAAQTSADSICFYSVNGNITFNGGTSSIYGILYAPNGTITDNGGPNGHVDGRIIAKTVNCNGSKFGVTSNANDLNSVNALTTTTVKLVK